MEINFNNSKFYFLTIDEESHKHKAQHVNEVFSEYDIKEVNPMMGIPKNQSGSIGMSRIIDYGLKEQDRTLPFQPFVLLEDDVSLYRDLDNIKIPDDTDLFYIGISPWGVMDGRLQGDINIIYSDVKNYDDIFKIYNMCSCHGIVICSARGASTYQKSMVESFYVNLTWDIILSKNLPHINAYALKTPMVYQDTEYGGQSSTKTTFNTMNKELYKSPNVLDKIMTIESFSKN